MMAQQAAELAGLCSHYKDTYDIHQSTIKQRDTLFYGLLMILSLFSIRSSSTGIVTAFVSAYLGKVASIEVGDSLAQLLLWFALVGWSIKYFQAVVHIERQYTYLHALENDLNKFYPGTSAFTREGAAYLQGYPLFLKWMTFVYRVIVPLAIVVVAANEIIGERKVHNQNFVVDGICFVIIVLSVALYLLHIHKGR